MRRPARSVLAFVSIAVGCRTPAPPIAPAPRSEPPPAIAPQTPTGARPTVELATDASEEGKLAIALVDAGARTAQLAIAPLADAELRPLLARLDPLPATPAAAPALRAPSAAPTPSRPVTPIAVVGLAGTPIADAPPATRPPAPTPPVVIEPLSPPELLPSGEVGTTSEVFVRFAEPMVPLAQVGELAATASPPATITPAVPGSWRWIDSRVARFTATTRFPNATQITITVPSGARALSGAVLAAPAVGTFATPPIQLDRAGLPVNRPDAPLILTFDQPFDVAAVVKVLRVEAAGKRVAFQPIELDAAKPLFARDPRIKVSELALPPHALLIAPTTTWPAGADLQIVLGAGAASLEGPRTSTTETRREVAIAKPFALRGIDCDGTPRLAGARCPASSSVAVELTNTPRSWRADQVRLDGANASEDGGSYHVRVFAPPEVGKTHTIELAADLVDELGQPLTGPRTASFVTKPAVHAAYLSAESGLFILDPRFQIPQWKVEAGAIQALRIQLYRVEPADYFAYRAYERRGRATPPGTLVYDRQHPVGPRHGAVARVDLRPALDPQGGVGHVIAVATSIALPGKRDASRTTAWIQVTRLGVTARFDRERVESWATQIDASHFLEPVAGATTTLVVDGRTERAVATAGADGHASLAFPAPPATAPATAPGAILTIARGADSVFEAIDRHERSVRTNNARWYVTDDRFTYKPKEPVYVKGWVRWTHDGVNPDLALPGPGDTVTWTLHDAKDAKLAAGRAPLSPQGGFDLEATIPENANLGTAHFTFETAGARRTWPIQIEEFRTPTFAVSLDDDVTHRGATPLYAGEAIEMTANAKYYSGGGLAGARVRWSALLEGASYVPPGWDEFSFAPPSINRYRYRSRRSRTSAAKGGALSGASSSTVSIEIAAVPDGEPSVLQVDATVTDLDRATIRESSRSIIVHPAAYYVGIREADRADAFELIATDVDGHAVAGVPIDVTVEGISAERLDDDAPRVIDTQRCQLTSATTPVRCAWKRRDDRTAYSVLAKVTDQRGRRNLTRYHVPWWRRERQGRDLEITADQPRYRPGDVAKLEIFSAIVPANAIVTVARQGVIAQRRVPLVQPITPFELPIEAAFIRNVHVVVDRVSKRATTDLPQRTSATVELALDPEHGRLAVEARPTRATVGPGERATFEVAVRHRGKPVAGAEVALLAVDEAVLAVSHKQHADPLAPFYFDVEAGTAGWSTLEDILDAGAELARTPGFERFSLDLQQGSGFGMGSGRGGLRGRTAAVPSVSIGSASRQPTRKDFRATAVWSPRLLTDAAGRASITVTMPDSLTRFRIVALATAETRYFGKAESSIATQRPLNVRATAPRFLSQGDAFSLPVIVQNLDRAPRTVDVAIRVANLLATGPTGKRVTIPPGQRAELRFELRTQQRGRATIQTVAQSGELFDASQLDLPVYVPATTEAFATYGIVDGDQPAFEQLQVPADLVRDVGGVETDLFASQISSLLDAFWYVQEYPFECAEQRSSRVLANAALVDVLDGFASPDRPSRAALDAQRERDVRELERDHREGGWGYFYGTAVDPFVTQQVVAALAAAGSKSKLFESASAELARTNLARIARLEKLAATPAAARTAAELAAAPAAISLASFELATLATLRKRPPAGLALRLHAAATTLGGYPLDARARVLAYLAKQPAAAAVRRELVRQLLSAAREDAATASITTRYTDAEQPLRVSSPKTTALVLDALIREAPEHASIPKLARGLLASRTRGRWRSTQENLAVLQSMRRYFDTYEHTAPAFTGKLWLGDAGYAEHAFAKRDARATVRVPWTALTGGTIPLALGKTGPGRMYYRVGIQYAPARIDLPPLDAGFVVRRSYAPAGHPSEVTRTPDGNYKIKLGARVVVTVEVVSTTQRDTVAVVDPLPAGFEPINTRLATSEEATTDLAAWDHVNLRDTRAEGFAMRFEGARRFTYSVRATTPGTFAAAPAKAEEMYAPETFGRSAGALVTIE